MATIESAQLNSLQQAELANLGCDDLAARESLSLDDLRTELAKLKSDAELEKACRKVLSSTGSQTATLMKDL